MNQELKKTDQSFEAIAAKRDAEGYGNQMAEGLDRIMIPEGTRLHKVWTGVKS